MQKNESRSSTNTDKADATQADANAGRPRTAAEPRAATAGPDLLTGGDGRVGEALVGKPGSRSPAEAFVEERDDVLAVISELEDQLDRYESVRETLERELREANEQSQGARQRIQELEWQVVTLQTRVDALEQVRQEISLLEEEITDANARAQRLNEQLLQAQQENARVAGELRGANKQLEELWTVRKERDSLRSDLKTARIRTEQLDASLRDIQQERGTLQARFEETRVTLEEMRAARHQAELKLRASEDANEELRKSIDNSERRIEALQTENRTLQARTTHLERENARLIEQQQFYECELTSLRNTNRNAESALANIKKAFGEVRAALADTRMRARRRTTVETWPRTAGGALRGIDGEATETHETSAAAETAAVGASTDESGEE